MVTILAPGGMNRAMELSVEVFPEAVPPQMIMDSPFSTPSQKYAIISGLAVLVLHRSTGVKGLSLNRLMVKVEPLVRDLPGVRRLDTVSLGGRAVQDRVGDRDLLAASLCQRDHERVQGVLVVEDQSSVRSYSYLRWKRKIGMLTPSQEMSSTFSSRIRMSITP